MIVYVAYFLSQIGMISESEICNLSEYKSGSPIYTKVTKYDNESDEIILHFDKYSMGYEGGRYHQKATIKLKEKESYFYKSKYYHNGDIHKMKIGYEFLKNCGQFVAIKFSMDIEEPNNVSKKDFFYKIEIK